MQNYTQVKYRKTPPEPEPETQKTEPQKPEPEPEPERIALMFIDELLEKTKPKSFQNYFAHNSVTNNADDSDEEWILIE